MNARREALDPRRALVSAVMDRDVTKIRTLLSAGADPTAIFKDKNPVIEALYSGQETVVRPFIERYRRERSTTSANNLCGIACRVFEDDEFSSSFAAELLEDIKPAYLWQEWTWSRVWGSLLAHERGYAPDMLPVVARKSEPLAGKVHLAIQHGWDPSEAWSAGWLPHHTYLALGHVEAALVCLEAGADIKTPMHRFGIGNPNTFVAWPELQAALRSKAALAQQPPCTKTRARQRA